MKKYSLRPRFSTELVTQRFQVWVWWTKNELTFMTLLPCGTLVPSTLFYCKPSYLISCFVPNLGTNNSKVARLSILNIAFFELISIFSSRIFWPIRKKRYPTRSTQWRTFRGRLKRENQITANSRKSLTAAWSEIKIFEISWKLG